MMIFLSIILAIFFAANMGGASFAASFAVPYGAKILDRTKAALLFILFVILGSILCGENVSVTLGQKIISPELISSKEINIIFLSAGLSMYVSNLIKIPQSTSLVTVAAISGVGICLGDLNLPMILFMLPFWLFLPVISYYLTYSIAGYIYPPRKRNFWIYEKFINQQSKLKKFVIYSSCYSAFSVGTNNVANVAGPLMDVSSFFITHILVIFGTFYGLGAFVFKGPLKTTGEKIVPLGLLTASIISIVSGSLMIIASFIGIPQSFVMLQLAAIFAVSSLKQGTDITFKDPLTRRIFYTWTINPVLTLIFSFVLSCIIL